MEQTAQELADRVGELAQQVSLQSWREARTAAANSLYELAYAPDSGLLVLMSRIDRGVSDELRAGLRLAAELVGDVDGFDL